MAKKVNSTSKQKMQKSQYSKVQKKEKNKKPNKFLEKILNKKNIKIYLFIFAFLLMFACIYDNDLIGVSGDANETFKVAKNLFNKNIVYSYVMYKGLYAFIPSIISYHVGNFLSINTVLILKIMNSLAFSYITVCAFPKLIQNMFKKEIKDWQILIFMLIIFIFERNPFTYISVDYSSLLFFLLSINLLYKYKENNKKIILFCFGLCAGASACFSGQYSIATYILVVCMLYQIIKNKKDFYLKVTLVLILVFSFSITKLPNTLFNKLVVDEGRKNGEWIPTAGDWFNHNLSGTMIDINYPAQLPDNLSQSIVLSDSSEILETIKSGQDYYTIKSYIKLILKQPVAFVVRWCQRLFLGVVNDPISNFPTVLKWGLSVIIFMGVSIYQSYLYVKKNYKFKDLFNINGVVFISFVFVALVPSFGHIENRYFIALRCLFMAMYLLSPIIPNFIAKIKNKKFNLNNLYGLFETFVFTILLIVIYYSMYGNLGVSLRYLL